jgi:inner membrane protein
LRRLTHAFTGFSIGFLAARLWGGNLSLTAYPLLGLLGGVFPDFDLKSGHRVYLHNLLSSVVVTIGLYTVLARSGLATVVSAVGSACFLAGWLSHILLDSLTLRGVALLYPFDKRMRGLRLVKSGDWRGEALAWLIGLGLIYLGFIVSRP